MTDRKPAPQSEALGIDMLVVGVFAAEALVTVGLLGEPTPTPEHSAVIVEEVPAPLVDLVPDAAPTPVPDLPAEPIPERIEPIAVPDPVRPPETYTPIASGPGFITMFGDGHNETSWHVARHANGADSHYANDWEPDNADFTSNGLSLSVRRTRTSNGFAAAEVKSHTTYGYGRYEVVMRPAAGSGLVSAFFTYTGTYFGDPHDEIDIEFLGLDTRKVELNYFKNGITGHHTTIDLPFDASEDFHLYAFDWWPDRIRWYIDGELVYETPEGDRRIPNTPGSVYMNTWTGRTKGLKSWHGVPSFEQGAAADYACVSFTPLGEEGRRCADVFVSGPELTAQFVSWFGQMRERLEPVLVAH